MGDRERPIVDIVLAGLLLLVPAFLLHSDGRFAGSLAGFVLGSCAAALMFLLLIYPLAKYSRSVKAIVTRQECREDARVDMKAQQSSYRHQALLHTGHKFYSPLAIALMVSMLIVVVTGFVGRYYLPQTSAEIREQRSRLATLRSAYDRTALILPAVDTTTSDGAAANASALPSMPVLQLVDGISDLEYAIGSHEAVQKIFQQWVGLHVVAAIVMYALLVLHIAAEVYYGLRWLA